MTRPAKPISTYALGLSALFLCTASSYAEPPAVRTVELDLRTASDPSDYTIVFCSYPPGAGDAKSLTGHAFIAILETNQEKGASFQTGFGMFPKKGKEIESLLCEVPLDVQDDLTKGSLAKTNNILKVRVDREKCDTVKKIIADWIKKGTYKAVEADCCTFCGQVADALGLKKPERRDAILPDAFLTSLLDLN